MEINNISFNDQSWQGVSLYLNDGTELVLFGKVWGLPNLGLMAHTLGGGTTTSTFTWQYELVWTVIRIDILQLFAFVLESKVTTSNSRWKHSRSEHQYIDKQSITDSISYIF
jgi:hypothetical protein